MEFSIIPDKDALNRCAWCQTDITDEMEVFGAGVKLNPKLDFSQYESHCIEVEMVYREQPVCLMIAAKGSDVKQDGKDAMFMCCSKACARELKTNLDKEILLGKMFDAVEL